MNQRYVYGLAALLAITGFAFFFYKWQILGFPVTKNLQTSVYTIESSVSFESGPGSIKVKLLIPTLTPGYRMLNENSVSRGYGFTVNYGAGGREAQWTIRRADGPQTIYYRISVYPDAYAKQSDTTPPFPPIPVINEPFRTAIDVLVSDVEEQSADTASFTAALLRRLNEASPDPNVELLVANAATPADFVETVTMILATRKIPARAIHGFILQGRQRDAEPVTWLEIHDSERWRYFNPRTGEENLPDNFFVWWRGNEPLVTVEGGSSVQTNFAVQETHLDAVTIAETKADQKGASLIDFSLYSLPIRTQAVYSVIIMIPIGAFVMVVMRNLIGIESFGTFMPVLIALAFRETKLLWGILLFILLVALGLSIRFLLERLRLLLVPRLCAVLIVVVMLMTGVSLVSNQLGLETGLSVALFPMVIISMTIERMSVMWEESGPADAIRSGLGSLVIAAIAYMCMGTSWLEHLIFTFPELLLVVLAMVVLLGRYTGYRLVELRRFRALDDT